MVKDLPIQFLREGLNRKYKICTELEKGFDLAIAIHDYVHYINENPILDYLFTENIQAEARRLLKEIKEAEIKAELELNGIFKEFEQLLKKKKIDNTEVLQHLGDYIAYKEGKVINSQGKVWSLNVELRNIISALYRNGYEKFVSKYIVLEKSHPEATQTISEYKISKEYNHTSTLRITTDDYDKKLKELKEKQHNIDTQLQQHTQADENYYITAGTVLNLAKGALELFESSEIPRKREILNYLLQNCTANGKKLEFTMRSPFNHILELANHPIGLRVVDEITTYFRTTSNYHYIPNLKDGIYPLVRPTSEQLAAVA